MMTKEFKTIANGFNRWRQAIGITDMEWYTDSANSADFFGLDQIGFENLFGLFVTKKAQSLSLAPGEVEILLCLVFSTRHKRLQRKTGPMSTKKPIHSAPKK